MCANIEGFGDETTTSATGMGATMICPHCGAVIDHIVRYGRSWARQCPKCGRAIAQNQIPEGFPEEHREAKPKPTRKRKVAEEEEEEKERPAPPFKRPKTPAQILRELCEYHGLKDSFIEYVVRKAEAKRGGLHPMEFRQMLQDLDSGIKTKRQAEYIVSDYIEMLMAEREKARQMGVPMVYPIGPYEEEAPTMGIQMPYGEYPEPYGPTMYGYRRSMPPGYRTAFGGYPRQPTLTVDMVERIFEEKVTKLLEEKRRRDEIETIKEQLANVPKIVEETVAKAVPQTPPNIVTTDQLMEALEKKTTEAQLEAQREQVKMWKELYDKALDEIRKTREEWAKDREEFLRKVEEAKQPIQVNTEGYQRDETRLLAEGIQILGRKTPIKDLGSILIRFFPRESGGQAAQPREKVGGESKIVDLLPKELVEEGE